MTTTELLADLASRDIHLAVADGRLHVDAPAGALTAADREALARHKAELLDRMAGVAPWDQAEADRLLSHLRSELRRIERQRHGGRLPDLLAVLMQDAIAIAQRLIREHEQERRRGWDALQLLKEEIAFALKLANATVRESAP